jgi:hypothetical protein
MSLPYRRGVPDSPWLRRLVMTPVLLLVLPLYTLVGGAYGCRMWWSEVRDTWRRP